MPKKKVIDNKKKLTWEIPAQPIILGAYHQRYHQSNMKFEKALLLAGLAIAILLALSAFSGRQEITAALVGCAFAIPGLILSHYKKTTLSRSYVLILITWLVPICVAFASFTISDIDEPEPGTVVLLLLFMSIICSVTFSITVAKIYNQHISVAQRFIWPSIIGGLSAILPIILQVVYGNYHPGSLLFSLGEFSVFPIWFYLTARHLTKIGIVTS